jgi:peptidoglycan/LPS O-acetylase OafA/YrhL
LLALAVAGFGAKHLRWLYLVGHPLFCLATAVVILACLSPTNVVARFFSRRGLVVLGRFSYSVYLWHQPAYNWISRLDWLPWWERTVLGISASLVLGVLSHLAIEQPVLRLRNRRLAVSATSAGEAG